MNDLSHSAARTLIQSGLDAPLADSEQARLAAHLETCAACRRYAADLERLQARLPRLMKARWPAGGAPDTQTVRLIQIRFGRQNMRKWILGIAGGAAAIAIFAFVFSGMLSRLVAQPQLQPAGGPRATATLTLDAPTPLSAAAGRTAIAGPGQCPPAAVTLKGSGTFVWPTVKHQIDGFDYTPPVHYGIDLAAAEGAPIVASDGGMVIYAGWNDWGYGNLVVLDHGNGYQTLYAHLDTVQVDCGQTVRQGEQLGLAGKTGHALGPHLHFEVLLNGAHIDPWTVLSEP